jgi:hypothetical protein
VNVPVGILGTVWAYRGLRDSGERHRARIDWWETSRSQEVRRCCSSSSPAASSPTTATAHQGLVVVFAAAKTLAVLGAHRIRAAGRAARPTPHPVLDEVEMTAQIEAVEGPVTAT